MTAFILISTSGELYCKETKQKFGETYYTFCKDSSDLIARLKHGGESAKLEGRAGLLEISPAFRNVDDKLLKAMLEGDTFPGSGVKTMSVWESQDVQRLMEWKRAYPDIFEEKKEVKPKSSKPKAIAKPKAKSISSDEFGEI